jgi:hypothetical protein
MVVGIGTEWISSNIYLPIPPTIGRPLAGLIAKLSGDK